MLRKSPQNGNLYLKKNASLAKWNTERGRSFRCIDCEKAQFLSLQEAVRDAVLHCIFCGGSLDETKESRERHLRRLFGPANRNGREETKKLQLKQICPCSCCRSKWTSMHTLVYHISESRDCLEQYLHPNNVLRTGYGAFGKGTLHYLQWDCRDFPIFGLHISGDIKRITSTKSGKSARAFIERLG